MHTSLTALPGGALRRLLQSTQYKHITAPPRGWCNAAAQLHAAGSSSGSSSKEGRLLGAHVACLQLMEQQFDVGGHVFRLITPADVDAVMDMYIAAGTDGDPYWTRVWPSAVALAHQLLKRPELVRGCSVADLGAGLGVAGLAAALAGAREVVLLDREPLALRCAAASAAASGLANLSPSASVTGIPELLAELADVLPHTPARDGAAINHGTGGAGSSNGSSGSARGLSFDTPVGVELFDWNSTQLGRKFDVVLACDVLYEDAAVEPISAVVPKLLKGGGRLLLADPPKRTTRNRERFVSILGAQSPKLAPLECSVQDCEVTKLDTEMLGGISSETIPVQLMVFKKLLGNETVGIKV